MPALLRPTHHKDNRIDGFGTANGLNWTPIAREEVVPRLDCRTNPFLQPPAAKASLARLVGLVLHHLAGRLGQR